jgi:ATP-dependent RNA helicase DDX55/SPB4
MQQQRTERASKKKLNAPWSEKMGRKEERERRREKKDKKKLWIKSQDQKETLDSKAVKRGRDTEEEDEDDWEEFAREERMAKKVRKGDVTQAVFDDEFMP